MVCTGNICRSPAMQYLAAREWRGAAEVRSAGTYAEAGMDVPREMRRAAEHHGLVIPRHRPTQLDSRLVAQADLVLVATQSHADWIRRAEGILPDHVFVLKEAVELATRAEPPVGRGPEDRLVALAESLHRERLRGRAPLRALDDPWARPQDVFDRVMAEIADAIGALGDHAGVPEAASRG